MLKKLNSLIDYRQVRDFVRAEYAVLITIGIASALVFAFFELADDVTEGETHVIDIAILEMFRVPGDPGQMVGSFWFQEAVRDITSLGGFTLLTTIVVLVVGFLLLTRRVAWALIVAVSVISGSVLTSLLKSGYDRPRPEFSGVVEHLSASFPSGHAMISAVTFLTLGALLARLSESWRLKIFYFSAAVLITVMVGVSRVILGMHFPSDVIAGWALGAAWALLWSAVALFLQRRGKI